MRQLLMFGSAQASSGCAKMTTISRCNLQGGNL